MYISLWENYRGHPDNISFMQFSTKIDGFEPKDSQGFENSYNSYEQYPLENFFDFHHLPKLYFGFNANLVLFPVIVMQSGVVFYGNWTCFVHYIGLNIWAANFFFTETDIYFGIIIQDQGMFGFF